MHFLISILIFAMLSVAAFSQGTWSTDDSEAAQGDASLSGYTDDPDMMQAQEEEVQLIEKEGYDPQVDVIEGEMDKERLEQIEEKKDKPY
jgi:hypothetical protein